MKKLYILMMISLLLFGCSDVKVKSLVKTIELIEDNQLYFNCSEDVVSAKAKSGNSIGYLCSVIIDQSTNLLDRNNDSIKISDFSIGDTINVHFTKEQKISIKNRSFEVKEVVLLD